MGITVVNWRGKPVAAKRSPRARNTASGQARPLDALTETVAPSGMSATASSAETMVIRGIQYFSSSYSARVGGPLVGLCVLPEAHKGSSYAGNMRTALVIQCYERSPDVKSDLCLRRSA